jgi:hypothetical protein
MQYVQTDTNGRKYIVNCCERCGKITEGIHTCTPNLVIERLIAELAACKRDAERYQWLRDNIYYSHCDECLELEADIPCHPSPNKADIDIAIDRAMKGTE